MTTRRNNRPLRNNRCSLLASLAGLLLLATQLVGGATKLANEAQETDQNRTTTMSMMSGHHHHQPMNSSLLYHSSSNKSMQEQSSSTRGQAPPSKGQKSSSPSPSSSSSSQQHGQKQAGPSSHSPAYNSRQLGSSATRQQQVEQMTTMTSNQQQRHQPQASSRHAPSGEAQHQAVAMLAGDEQHQAAATTATTTNSTTMMTTTATGDKDSTMAAAAASGQSQPKRQQQQQQQQHQPGYQTPPDGLAKARGQQASPMSSPTMMTNSNSGGKQSLTSSGSSSSPQVTAAAMTASKSAMSVQAEHADSSQPPSEQPTGSGPPMAADHQLMMLQMMRKQQQQQQLGGPSTVATGNGSKQSPTGPQKAAQTPGTLASYQAPSAGYQGWQTVATSVSSGGVTAAAPASGLDSKWRPPRPPAQVANAAPKHHQQAASRREQEQQQQQFQLLVSGPNNNNNNGNQDDQDHDQSQLERPTGYSYDSSSSYTYTSPLAPAKHELMLLSEQNQPMGAGAGSISGHQRQRQRPRDFSPVQQQQQQVEHHYTTIAADQQYRSAGLVPPTPTIVQQQQHQQQQIELTSTRLPPPPPSRLPNLSPLATNPCKPLSLQQQQQQQQIDVQLLPNELLLASGSSHQFAADSTSPTAALGNPRYLRAGTGTRLRSQFIFKVIRADSLTDCELACSRASQLANNNPLDACRSFNFRAYFAAENCELSRLDLQRGGPQLGDSSHFEQHTQFDYYTLDGHSAAALLLAQQQSQQQQQQQQLLVDPLLASECLDVSQSCSQDGMEFTLRTQEPFNGRIYTYGFYESCYVDGEGSTQNVLRISRSNGLPRCGTQQIGDLMTNIVVVQFNDHVQTTRDKKYNLTCYLSGPGEAVVTSSYLDTKVDERSHPVQIEHLPPQNVVTSNVQLRVLYRGQPTNTIAVGDLLTFRLETGPSSQGSRSASNRALQGQQLQHQQQLVQNEIFATNVLARDPYSGRQVQLIDGRGCPVDPVNVFPELQRTPDGSLESEFYAFKIPDSNFLIFQATVRTCKAPCEPVICHSAAAAGERPPSSAGAHQQQQQSVHQLTTGASIKGGPSLGAYLMAPHQSSAPSWGKRRRRRRRRRRRDIATDGDIAAGGGLEANEMLVSGESVEHVIPVRLRAAQVAGSQTQGDDGDHEAEIKRPRGVRTRVIGRPDLSEAEAEVKEMFRVYLSRAEINNSNSNNNNNNNKQRQQQQSQALTRASGQHHPTDQQDNENHEPAGQWEALPGGSQQQDEAPVCLSPWNYLVMLFAVISLSLMLASMLIVFAYVQSRRAKFTICESIRRRADSMF